MRYNRQEIFNKIGKEKQIVIENSTISIVGLGALGSVISEMLVRAGVKNLIIIDRDIVELTNLQRQSLYIEEDIGKLKAIVAKEKLEKINSEVKIKYYVEDLDSNNINILQGDLILDCTDNLDTRFLINDYCKLKKIPWVYSGVIGSRGMVLSVLPDNSCFSCIFKESDGILGTCDTEGVISSIVHCIAGIQFNEAIKILTKQLTNIQLLYFDIWNLNLNKIKIEKNKNCGTCNGNYKWLNGYGNKKVLKLCGNNKFQIKLKPLNLKILHKKLINNNVLLTKQCLILEDMTIFKNGRILVKAETKERAKSLIDKYLK